MRSISLAGLSIALLTTAASLAGCRSKPVQANIVVPGQTAAAHAYVYPESASHVWIPVRAIAESLGMRYVESDGRLLVGTTDPAYTVSIEGKDAQIGDQIVTLSDAPKRIGSETYMTDRALGEWWGTPLHWDGKAKQVTVTPANHRALAAWLYTYNPTNSPTLKADLRTAPRPFKAAAIVTPEQLVQYALQMQGAPYQFQAEAKEGMERPAAFNSSSLIRHIYGHFGIALPATTLAQAKAGTTVLAPEQLLPGDLLFFDSAGGPVSANRIVAHIGMYAGNRRFIHAIDGSGVTAAEFTDDWRERFLFAKRIAAP
jgi:cell wall-associated NlpC family hydrolase